MRDMQATALAPEETAIAAEVKPESAPAWLAVASLAISTFASVTTEFMPVGLLTPIATSLGVSEGTAGLLVTVPGIVAAVTGPLLIVASGRLDRRTLLLVLSALLVASNLLAALAPNLATMLVARMLLGLVVGGFWTFAPGATTHMVPPRLQAQAMSYVLAGISIATVVGIPAGALLGNLAGWRAAFGTTAVLAAAVLLLQLRILPAMPAARASVPRDLLVPFTARAPRAVLIAALFLVTGHFMAYTYLGPLLRQVYGMSADGITSLLLLYGIAGFAGTFLGGQLARRSVTGLACAAALLIGGAELFSALVGGGTLAAGVVVFAWGVAFGFVPVAMTTWMQQALPAAPEAGQAMLVTAFQVSIAFGAFAGGRVVDAYGVTGALLASGVLAALAALIISRTRAPATLEL